MIAQQTAKKAKLLDKFLEKHEAQYPFPEDIELIQDVDYMGDGKPCHFMDIYRPKSYKGKLPVMFNLHGGGFLLGKKEEGHLFCAEMSRKGFLVFSLEYPLAPETLFPQILKDLMTGMGNTWSSIESYDGDRTRIYMTGTSGMYYTTKPDSIGLFLPSYVYGKQWKKSSFYPYINPENEAILRHLPPAFLVTAYGDMLRNYSRQYAEAMKRCGVICHLEDFDTGKKLPHAFSTTFPEMPESKRANERMVKFLLEH